MDQIKIGQYLKLLRKEKNMTQEELAEKFNVTNRTVSRWENGINMPDLALLIDLAEFYQISIEEIIQGEKQEKTDQNSKNTAKMMAEYTIVENRKAKERILGISTMISGGIITLLALMLFPTESSWNGIYTILGAVIFISGYYFNTRVGKPALKYSLLSTLAVAIAVFTLLITGDYFSVKTMHQAPRFAYRITYDSRFPHSLRYDSLFYSAVRSNIGTNEETVRIIKH